MSKDPRTREFLQGYAAALADFNRLNPWPRAIVETMEGAGLDYHQLKDAGADIHDLGELARARDAVNIERRRPKLRETLTPDQARSHPKRPG